MSDIAEDTLLDTCCRAFAEEGRLAQATEHYRVRDAQIDLAVAVTEALQTSTVLVAEAGTGTGKTFAYLVPALLSGKKTLVSTATKTLQDQLYLKDIPFLRKALGVSARAVNLKGRGNYLCLYRIHQYAEESRSVKLESLSQILRIREKLPRLKAGEKSELPEIPENDAIWSSITATADNCLGKSCDYLQDCYLTKVRRRAMKAQIIVVNHHVFFADSQMKEEGLGEMLPSVSMVVFDEAHQLPDIISTFQEQRWSTWQLKEWLDKLSQQWPVFTWHTTPMPACVDTIKKALQQIEECLHEAPERQPLRVVLQNQTVCVALKQIMETLAALLDFFHQHVDKNQLELLDIGARLGQALLIMGLLQEPEHKTTHWVSRFTWAISFHRTPVDISAYFSGVTTRLQTAFVLTSATLTMADCFDVFTKRLGIVDARQLLLASPFDYKKQAVLYLPRGIPDPRASDYYDAILRNTLPVIHACQGRTFFLFTSHRALRMVAQILRTQLSYPLLVQGDEPKSILLSRFKSYGNAVLLGTASFWEGVDVKGEALSCVIIDKLPFTSPQDPVIAGRMRYYEQMGQSAFDALTLPEVILALKQGVGRLIRDDSDYGVLVIADPRLTGRAYGKYIFDSLPVFTRTRDINRVLAFIKDIIIR